MTEMSEAQKKRMEDLIKDLYENPKGRRITETLYKEGYQAGLSDPSRSEALDKVLEEAEKLLSRFFESFDYSLKNNITLIPSEQYGLLFLLDEKGRMIFKLSKEKELLTKLRDLRKVNSSEGVGGDK